MVNMAGGNLVHDLSRYWPHYTPITTAADQDLMLFSVSTCTGHEGTRIGYPFLLPQMIDGVSFFLFFWGFLRINFP